MKRRQKTAALGAVFGVLSTTLASPYAKLQRFRASVGRLFLTFFPPPPILSQGTYFGSLTSEPEIGFSRFFAGHGSRHMWDSVPNLSIAFPSASLFVLPL